MSHPYFFRWMALFCFIGELTAIGGWYLFDWKLTSSLPFAIVFLILLFSSWTTSYATQKWSKIVAVFLFIASVSLAISYIMNWIELANCWQLMLVLLLVSIQLALITIWIKTVNKRKYVIGIPTVLVFTGLFIQLYCETETIVGILGLALSGFLVLIGLVLKQRN